MRWGWALIGLAASVGVTAAMWLAGFPGFFFLAIPFLGLPFLRRDAPSRPTCAQCGYVARGDDEAFCPRDGSGLS